MYKVILNLQACLTARFFTISGILRSSDLFVVEVIHDHRMTRLCPAVWQFVIHKGTAVFLGQLLCTIFQGVKIASISLMVNGIVERNQVGIFLVDVVQNLLLEAAPKI